MNKIFLYSFLFIVYYISLFVDWKGITYLAGVLAIVVLCYSLPKAKTIYRTMGIIFIITGLLLYIQQGRNILLLPFHMTSTVTLLSVLFVLPFINSAVIVGRYDKNVNKLLKKKVDNLGQLYSRTSFVSFLLGSFLNVATLPLVNSVVSKNLQDKSKELRDKFITQSLLRGYAFSLSWSPIELMVVLSVDITGTSYIAVLPLLILFVVIMFSINMAVGRKYRKVEMQSTKASEDKNKIDKKVIRKIGSLVFFLLLFVSVIVLINQFTELGFLEIVALVILPYSLLWVLAIKRFRSYFRYSIPRWAASTRSLGNYMALFLSAGLFIVMLNESFLIQYIHYPFEFAAAFPLLLFVSVQVLFLGLAMVGFHPLVTISILGSVLAPFLDTVHPLSLAVVLITSGLSTVMAGPFNISVSIMASLMTRNPYQISYWNIVFAFIFSSTGSLIAFVIQFASTI